MATVTYNCTKDASAWYNGDAWSGHDDHHPVGQNSNGNRWASFLYFPINFTGMTSITSATLKVYGAKVSGTTHTSGSSSTVIYARRMTSDWGEGTDRGENVWSTNETWDWSNRVAAGNTTSGQISITTGPVVNNTLYSFDITNLVKLWAPTSAGGSGNSNYGLLLINSSNSSADAVEYYSRHVSGKVPQLTIVYETNTAPNAPTLTSPISGNVTNTLTPTFQGTFSDPDSGDTMSAYQILLYSDSGGTVLVWDSGTITTTAATSFSRVYGGTALTGNTTYYWKARTRDTNGSTWGNYSALSSFKTNTAPPTPTNLTPASGGIVSTLTPAFGGSSADGDPGDSLSAANVIVYTDSGGSTVKWDSGDLSASGSTFSITYAGTALSTDTTYYWKARTKDTNGAYSSWTALQSFSTYAVGTPTGLSPSNSKVNTLTPTFTGTAAETMNAFQIIVYASDGTTQVDDTGTVTASGTSISRVYSGSTALTWGTQYKWKARTRNTSNVWSSYSSLQTFYTNSSPTATQSSPTNNAAITTATPTYTASYSDIDVSNGFSDNPTNYTVEVVRNSDSVVMYTLSKTTGLSNTSNSMAPGDSGVTQTAGAGGTTLSLNTVYKWRARFTDSSAASNATGSYTGYWLFKPTAVPTATSFVAQAGDLTTSKINKPNPTFTWSYSGSGSKAQLYYRVRVTRTSDSVQVYDTENVTSTATSYALPTGILANTTEYKFDLTVADTDSLEGTATVTYTTTWTPPDAVTNFSATGDDTRGYVVLDWDTSSLSGSDFLQYKVYKSTDGGNNWTVLATITNQATSHYDDYPASFSTPYTYKVTQWKNISGGSPLESPDSDIVTTSIDGDEWWLVVDGRDDLSFVLYVDDESHSSPFQQEIFEPFGRSRKVIVRSGIWGREGSLSFYILSENRIDYLNRLAGIQALTVPVYLKNPFGDTHLVYLEPATVTYLPGGGARVSVNYTEVES